MEPIQFTIFLPVKNGGEYLKVCYLSILSQTYSDFELVILDNCSNVEGMRWFKDNKDPRVRVCTTNRELSIEENWFRILNEKKYKYMTIVSHDDILDKIFLEEIVSLIKTYPGAPLYQTHFRLIDKKGHMIRHCLPMPSIETRAEFLAARLTKIRDSYGTGYVMDTKVYDRVGGIPMFTDLLYADDALWIKIIAQNNKITSSRECFSYRIHEQSTAHLCKWKEHLSAAKSFYAFLANLAIKDIVIRNIINKYAQSYFTSRIQTLFRKELRRATFSGEKINCDVFKEVDIFYQLVSPDSRKQWNKTCSIQLSQFINLLPGRKFIHLLFSRIYKRYINK